MLTTRLIQIAGVFLGVAATVWLFLYLFAFSMVHDGAERFTALIPILGLALYLAAVRKHLSPGIRWALLEFFAGSLVSYLLLQFVVIRFI